MTDRPAHRRRRSRAQTSLASEPAGSSAPGTVVPLPASPPEPPLLPADVRTGTRTVTLRVNRVANALIYGELAVVVLIFLFGAYRLTASGPLSGIVIIALALVLSVWPLRRLGRGRLLGLDTTPTQVTLVASFEPAAVVPRTGGLRAVLWVDRRYEGASPRLRGFYLVDGVKPVATARPLTFTAERLQRYLGNVGIPSELVDARVAPFARLR